MAANRPDVAQAAVEELRTIAAVFGTAALQADVASAEGWLASQAGDEAKAVSALSRAIELWGEVRAPYESARARLGLAKAYGLIGDGDSAKLELTAARATFDRLGAAPEAARARWLLQNLS